MNPALLLGAAALALTGLVACGGDDDTGSPSASDATGPAADAPTGGEAVEIKATDKLAFDPTTLTATVGTPFTGRLVQVGPIPHDLQLKEFGIKPEDTRVMKDGESKEFTFTPDKAGKFEFICTIHPATMKGTLTVS